MPPISKKQVEQLQERVRKIRKSDKQNQKCADCPSRATTYVCTDFSTFICTSCAGLHRKFAHRVKSLSMATFTQREVDNLAEGGNSVHKRKYLARFVPTFFKN